MDFKDLVKKYDIKDEETFKNDLFDFFLDKEVKTKKNELLQFFDELSKQINEISKNNSIVSKKNELGEFASKASKEYAEANNIDSSLIIERTGQNGRITKSDIIKVIKKPKNKKVKTVEKIENHFCKGIKTGGISCDKTGVYKISDEWFCGFHKHQGKVYHPKELVDSEDEDDEIEV